MKTEAEKLLDEISYEHAMNQYAVAGATRILGLIIREADAEMLKQEPFDCLEGLWSLLDKTEKDMMKTEKKFEARLKLSAEANKHD